MTLQSCGHLFCVTALLFGTLCGCKPQKETENPLFVRAQDATVARDFAVASEAWVAYLDENPKSAVAHRKLGDIYFAELDNLEYAIYHYDQSRRLDPNQKDAFNLQQWSQDARRKLYAQLSRTFAPAESETKRDYEAKINALTQENARLKQRIHLAQQSRTHQTGSRPNPADPVTGAESGYVRRDPPPDQWHAQPNRETPSVPPGRDTNTVRTHKVVPGDTLSRIARRYYGDARFYPRIVEANKTRYPNVEQSLREGMELTIPPNTP